MKELLKTAWDVSEEVYRQDPAYSYSTIARFEREGFRNINTLFEKVTTPSLTFGSLVDCLITEPEDFDNRFFVTDILPEDNTISGLVKTIYDNYGDTYFSLNDVPDDFILGCIGSYQRNWKPETRCKVIREKGNDYYELLHVSEGKIVVSSQDYADAIACADELYTNPVSKDLLFPTNPDIEVYWQLKFKGKYKDISLRCMMDAIVVNHINKGITLVDLKTTGHPEEEFENSFVKWRYDIQATLYTEIFMQNAPEELLNYHINPYHFLCINKKTKAPIIWKFHQNFCTKALETKDGNTLRNWREIVEDLDYYTHQPIIKYSKEVVNNHYMMDINCFK